jgi:uncharacterized protein YbgA (DUF1722 family)
MARHHQFLIQLENFRHETAVAAQYLYAQLAVQHAGSKSDKLLSRLNETPRFWKVHMAATQTAAYVTLGRIFDTTSNYNVDALLTTFEESLHLFSRQALAARKSEGSSKRPDWLDEYLNRAHYPTSKDVERLRDHIIRHREFYDRAVKPVRHKYLAHREKQEQSEVQELYGRGKVKEMWKTVTFLLALHEAMLQQYMNGRKPLLKPIRYSVKTLYENSDDRTGPHEAIVKETKRLMERLRGDA